MNFNAIIEQIAEGHIEEAIDTFRSVLEQIAEKEKSLLGLKSRYSSLDDKKKKGIISDEKASLEERKITETTIKVISEIESLIKESNTIEAKTSLNKTPSVRRVINEAIVKKGYEIESQMYYSQSIYYYRAIKKGSQVRDDLYVIEVLNWSKINGANLKFNQKYLDFFSLNPPQPFVKLIEFNSGIPSFIIRRYAKGIVLTDLIKDGIRLSLLKTLETIIAISKGLKELDKAHFFYNNLNPDQIILDINWNLQILPLNIFEENMNNVITWKNLEDSIKFMSPEQLALTSNKSEQNKLTIISNQYSLGLILFYIFTGETIFDGKGLPNLYEDRIDDKDSASQLTEFYDLFYKKLLQYEITTESAQKYLKEFKHIFKKLIQDNPDNRYQRFEDFIHEIDFLALQIIKERKSLLKKPLLQVIDSFRSSIKREEENEQLMIEGFYEDLASQLPTLKNSIEKERDRNIKFQYVFDYLFSSISSFDNEKHLEEAVSCLVKTLHFDFTIEDYELFFNLLKKHVSKRTTEWNDQLAEAWDDFINASLDAIETVLKPIDVLATS